MAEFHGFPTITPTAQATWTLAAAARQAEAEALVCTQKDLVKIDLDQLGDRPLWAVRVGIDFIAGRDEFEEKLRAV